MACMHKIFLKSVIPLRSQDKILQKILKKKRVIQYFGNFSLILTFSHHLYINLKIYHVAYHIKVHASREILVFSVLKCLYSGPF